ncbi:MAG TPA: hypothetical protein VGO31_10215 [Microbacteriaceae bacterium]|nr:hypothetical protein [Microbacteriaceae bacterium]
MANRRRGVATAALVGVALGVAGGSGAGAAAPATGPSEASCAQAFDRPANVALRQRLAREHVLRAGIFATTIPSCAIKFQLAGRRMLTASADWKPLADLAWKARVTHGGMVGDVNAAWARGLLKATGPRATYVQQTGPGPTLSSCLTSWNAAPPANLPATAPAFVQALNGGVTIDHKSGARTEIAGYACTVTIVRAPRTTQMYVAPWHGGAAARWTAPLATGGLLAGTSANADLGAGGRLVPRAQPALATLPVAPAPSTPGITRQLGATGWAGGVHLFQTLAQATARFGPPSSKVRQGLSCQVIWGRLGLIATFAFGRSITTGCAPTSRAMGFTGVATWSTAAGLTVGMPESAIEQRYPGAQHLAESGGQTLWYLVPRSGRSGPNSLTATTSALGTVASISVGATTESGNDGAQVSGMVIWRAP